LKANSVAANPSRPGGAILEDEAGGLLTIDLGALVANWKTLRGLSGGAECAAVVKADAYGIGIEPAVAALARAGCRTYFVAHLSEGIRVRAVDTSAAVYVLNGLLPGTAPTYAAHGLRPVLGARAEIAEWASFCHLANRAFEAALHVDTGMNRLGLRSEQAAALTDDELAPFTIALLMTHLVSAEEPDSPLNARQIAAFAAARQRFPHIPASLCNSSGIFLAAKPHFDLVRPGYALYGGNPLPGRDNPMQPVVRLEGRIVQVRAVMDGETVGYNAQWTARGERRIATISVGYADGYPRNGGATDAKPGGAAIVAGIRCPFAGRVSMDLITIDVTAVPASALQRGRLVTLIGDGITLDAAGETSGTTGYEMLTNLGRRYARGYIGV